MGVIQNLVLSKFGFSQNYSSDLLSILDFGACNDSMLVAYNMRSQIQVNNVFFSWFFS